MISVLRKLRDSAGTDWDGVIISTATPDNYSESFAPGGMDKVGIIAKVGAWTATTTYTLDIALQMSPDGGTTWVAAPAAENASTGAALTQITTSSTNIAEFWPLFLSETGNSGSNPLYRFALTHGAADSAPVLTAWLVMRKYNQRHP